MSHPLKRNSAFIWLNLSSIVLLLLLGSVDASADWRQEWEKTVEAAKKEGQINFYVGRYGQRPLLEKFRKKYNPLRTPSLTEFRARLINPSPKNQDIRPIIKLLGRVMSYRK